MEVLELLDINKGLPGISPIEGANLYENCMVRLHRSEHISPTTLYVNGLENTRYSIYWENTYNEMIGRTYADEQSVTERAAVCISVLLALKQTSYTIIERARKGTGFDYMLGDKDDLYFQPKARLEISGIAKEDENNRTTTRYRLKARQTQKSDNMELPAYVSIIEFATPKAIFGLTNSEK